MSSHSPHTDHLIGVGCRPDVVAEVIAFLLQAGIARVVGALGDGVDAMLIAGRGSVVELLGPSTAAVAEPIREG
jgi:hypothetical protein